MQFQINKEQLTKIHNLSFLFHFLCNKYMSIMVSLSFTNVVYFNSYWIDIFKSGDTFKSKKLNFKLRTLNLSRLPFFSKGDFHLLTVKLLFIVRQPDGGDAIANKVGDGPGF